MIEQFLLEAHEYNTHLESLKDSVSIASIAPSGGSSTITLSVNISGITTDDYIYILYGANEGYYKITAVGSNTVTVATELINVAGDAEIYAVKSNTIQRLIDNATLAIEQYTGISFSGTEQKTEYYSGTGADVLILNHKDIISIDQIVFVDGVFNIDDLSGVDLIPDQGILKAYSLNTYSGTLNYFPAGNRNIKIVMTVGYLSIPVDVQTAIIKMAINILLCDESGFSGDSQSLSIVAWSSSFGPQGKFSGKRKALISQVKNILKKYRSGVVG